MNIDSYASGGGVTITVTWEEMHEICSVNTGYVGEKGGFQRLFANLQLGFRIIPGVGPILSMSSDNARRVVQYSAPSYGPGTYQKKLTIIAPKVAAALSEHPAQPDLPLEL